MDTRRHQHAAVHAHPACCVCRSVRHKSQEKYSAPPKSISICIYELKIELTIKGVRQSNGVTRHRHRAYAQRRREKQRRPCTNPLQDRTYVQHRQFVEKSNSSAKRMKNRGLPINKQKIRTGLETPPRPHAAA